MIEFVLVTAEPLVALDIRGLLQSAYPQCVVRVFDAVQSAIAQGAKADLPRVAVVHVDRVKDAALSASIEADRCVFLGGPAILSDDLNPSALSIEYPFSDLSLISALRKLTADLR